MPVLVAEMILSKRKLITGLAATTAYAALVGGGFRSGNFGCDDGLLAGDSNAYSGLKADGSAGYDPAIDVSNNLCLEFRNASPQAGKFWTQICQDQLQYNFAVPPGSIGAGLTFMRDYYLPTRLAPNRNVRITAVAVGGTGFSDGFWTAPSGAGLLNAISRVNQATALDSRNAIKFILWCSGANDAIAGMSQATYLANFVAMAAYMRANITGATNVPILVEGLVPAWVATNVGTFGPVDAALKSIPANVSKTGYVDMTNLDGLGTAAVGQTAIPYHLTAASQRLVGNPGFGRAWANLSA